MNITDHNCINLFSLILMKESRVIELINDRIANEELLIVFRTFI